MVKKMHVMLKIFKLKWKTYKLQTINCSLSSNSKFFWQFRVINLICNNTLLIIIGNVTNDCFHTAGIELGEGHGGHVLFWSRLSANSHNCTIYALFNIPCSSNDWWNMEAWDDLVGKVFFCLVYKYIYNVPLHFFYIYSI